ncbi:MAG: hypothetical protein ACI4CT_08690 [Lachnospiraceae bacterium]
MRKWRKWMALWMAGIMIVPGIMPCHTKAATEQKKQLTVYDYIDIGNISSEGTRVSFLNASDCLANSDNGYSYRTLGGLEEVDASVLNETNTSGTSLGQIGYMDVTINVNPDTDNYLTVKLWGNDTTSNSNGMLFCGYMTEVATTEAGESLKAIRVGDDLSLTPVRNALVDRQYMVELNSLSQYGIPQVEDGFQYATYTIPKKAVTDYRDSNNQITMRIYSSGAASDYSSESITQQTGPSRGIYEIYVTKEANVTPDVLPDEYLKNEPVIQRKVSGANDSLYSVYSEDDMSALRASLVTVSKSTVSRFMERQIYLEDAASRNYPSYVEGMPTRTTGWKTKSSTDTDWKDAYYNSYQALAQNLTTMNMFQAFKEAYVDADCRPDGVEQVELMNRLLAGYDFLTRAQGSNGGYYSSSGWIGGPERADAGGNNLTGFGLRYAGKSFVELVDYLKLQKESGKTTQEWYEVLGLSTKIDADADGTVDTTRGQAYATMFSGMRDYLVSLDGAGHAPNQDMADLLAALYADQSLALLDGYLVTSSSWENQTNGYDIIKDYLDIGLGRKASVSFHDFWISPKGTILENLGSLYGGYTGDYGTNAVVEAAEIVNLGANYYAAKSSAIAAVNYETVIDNMYDAIEEYYYHGKNGNGDLALYSEGVISTRNGYNPGTLRYPYDVYSILDFNNVVAIKVMQYYLEDSALQRDIDEGAFGSGAHFEDNALKVISILQNFEEIIEKIKQDGVQSYQFPIDRDATYAVADEMARTVTIKDGTTSIQVALNWRHWMHSCYSTWGYIRSPETHFIYANNLARIHHTTDQYDQYGYARMETKGFATDSKITTDSSYDSSDGRSKLATYLTSRYLEGLLTLSYGDYEIVMNCDKCGSSIENDEDHPDYDYSGTDRTWYLVGDAGITKGTYYDMISGRFMTVDEKTVAEPSTTYVLKSMDNLGDDIRLEQINSNILESGNLTSAEVEDFLATVSEDAVMLTDYKGLTDTQREEVIHMINQKVTSGGSYKSLAGFCTSWNSAIYQVRARDEVTTESATYAGTSPRGGQIRITRGDIKAGLRFRSYVNKGICDEVVADEKKQAEFGMILVPTIGLTKAGLSNEEFKIVGDNNYIYPGNDTSQTKVTSYVRVKANRLFTDNTSNDFPYHEYTAVLVGLKESYYNRAFTARTYYIPADAYDENGELDYSQIAYGSPIQRSMYDVAYACLHQEDATMTTEERSYYQYIIGESSVVVSGAVGTFFSTAQEGEGLDNVVEFDFKDLQ